MDWIAEFLARERLPEGYRGLIDRVHAPLADFIAERATAATPLAVGLCGAQGSGKSTAAAVLRELMAARPPPAALSGAAAAAR